MLLSRPPNFPNTIIAHLKTNQRFPVTAIQWTAERDSLPLRYAFGALSTGSDCELWGPPDHSPVFADIMPAGSDADNTLVLCVIVWDAFDSLATAEINITSNPLEEGDLDPSAVEDLWLKHVEVQLNSGNLDQALSAVNNIADTVRGSSFTTGRKLSKKGSRNLFSDFDSGIIGKYRIFFEYPRVLAPIAPK